MKKIITILFVSLAIYSNAQTDTTKNWKKGGMVSLGLTQVSFTNWASGGQNSVSVTTLLDLFANYKKNNLTWDNSLSMGYGIINQDRDMKKTSWVKNDDRIQLTSKYGQHAFKHWFYSGLLDFKTQFAPGYDNPFAPISLRQTISDFMSPGYGIVALGMDYKPNDKLTILIAPLTGKFTVVNNQALADAGAFGVEKAVYDAVDLTKKVTDGKRFRGEFGGFLKAKYTKDLTSTLSFKTNLELFSNYINNPQNIDVFWDNLLSLKVVKYVTVTYNALLIYDHDIIIKDENGNSGPRTQFKSVISANFSYKF